jgi:mgtE-like transporter
MQRSIFAQGLAVLLACATIQLLAGDLLQRMVDYFTTLLPGIILMVPPLLDLRGNINGAFASRLGTGLHLGSIPAKLRLSPELKVNLLSTLVLSLLASISIGIFAYLVGLFLATEIIGLADILIIALVAGVTSGVILAFLTILVAVFTYLRGWDPDNVTAPLMATLGDLVTILSIGLGIWVVTLV